MRYDVEDPQGHYTLIPYIRPEFT